MDETRSALLEQLESYYRTCGWTVRRAEGDVLAAVGPGGVTWHGIAVLAEDTADPVALDERLSDLAERRMPAGGELCPLDLLPAPGCEATLQQALQRTGLRARPHVSVYGLAVAA